MAVTLELPIVSRPARTSQFNVFAWAILIWNIIVVLWGALVRATGAGAGCGSHWPLCNGDVIPQAPAAKTIIEFTHRLTSGLALIGVVVLVIWAFRAFPKHHPVRRFAALSTLFIAVEALLGAGIVLLRYVEQNASVGRAIYLCAHLANTQLLLGTLALTAWFSRLNWSDKQIAWPSRKLTGVLPVVLLVGISGAIAALGDTLFPSTSFADGVRQEMADSAHFLLRLRVLHPAFAVFSAIYVGMVALWTLRNQPTPDAVLLARYAAALMVVQMVAGLINVWLLAPIWMQIVHLLLADVLWVVLILLMASCAPEPVANV